MQQVLEVAEHLGFTANPLPVFLQLPVEVVVGELQGLQMHLLRHRTILQGMDRVVQQVEE
jgi:hypothetical protein